jgi:tetratricopeptide (TPR) repeat protein
MIVKIILFGFFFLFLFFFLVGLFVGDETSADNAESISTVTEEDNGTTYWNEKGNAALANEKKDSALYYYQQALDIDPENVYALYNTGLAHILRQDYRKGNSFTRQCLRFHPDYDPAWWLLGYSYDLTNQTDSAVYSLEQAYRHDYSQPDFLQLLAEVYVKQGKQRSALEVYQKLVTLDTARADILRKMAELDPSNAEKYMQRVRSLEN